ncbi:hypothetical protein [Ancylomarina sp. 16SWW S1-10-2]|uniref:hypothetical protein n=1 Tax=Ancylomarina sp. 16SWW S1-10-2 TaxID=2499681 RepID=UPI0012AD3727|nr:hypothetical protein [Ancylomarina sp. 16SWW S1-10-2]MRT92139.1 hypothetical protein [Ancylomarina sp. 16SWW S1-10-2]
MSFSNACKKMSKLYDKGFESFRPMINEDEKIEHYVTSIQPEINKLKSSIYSPMQDIDDDGPEEWIEDEPIDPEDLIPFTPEELIQMRLEEIVGDEEFASMLNKDGEIVVGDSLYKYTDGGLFMCRIEDENELKKDLTAAKEFPDLMFNTTKTQQQYKEDEEIDDDHPYPGDDLLPKEEAGYRGSIVNINSKVRRYRVIHKRHTTTVAASRKKMSSPPSIDDNMWRAIQSWKTTKGRQTKLAGLFGERRVSTIYMSKRRRTKVIYSNQNYGLYSRTVIKVKYQRRKCRCWWRTKGDELILGANLISYYIEMDLNYTGGAPKSTWSFDGKQFDDHLNDITYKLKKSDYPNWPFETDLKVVVDLELMGYNYTKNMSGKELNKIALNLLASQGKSLLRKLGKNSSDANQISMMAFGVDKVYFTNIDFSEKRKNSRRIKKIYATRLRVPDVVYNPGTNKFRISMPKMNKLKTLEVDFYGGARRGDKWVGARIVYP